MREPELTCAALVVGACAIKGALAGICPLLPSLGACTRRAAFLLPLLCFVLCLGLTPWLCFTEIPLLAGDVFLEKAVEHSLHRTCNQIGSVGNTKVAEWVKGSIHQQFYKIRDAVQAAGGDIHGCIFRGTGHLYIPSDPDMPELVGGN